MSGINFSTISKNTGTSFCSNANFLFFLLFRLFVTILHNHLGRLAAIPGLAQPVRRNDA